VQMEGYGLYVIRQFIIDCTVMYRIWGHGGKRTKKMTHKEQ